MRRVSILVLAATAAMAACQDQPLAPDVRTSLAFGGVPGPPPGVPIPSHAQPPFGKLVVVDGTLAPGEWQTAPALDLPFLSPPISAAQLYLRNDAASLYFALSVTIPGDPAYQLSFLEIGLVNPSAPGASAFDVLRLINGSLVDGHASTCPPPALVCGGFVRDVLAGGMQDATWAWSTDGTTFEIEISHPLDGGDALDIGAARGDEVTIAVVQAHFVSAADPLNPAAGILGATYLVR